MTDRLYYTDPYLRAFDATSSASSARGDRSSSRSIAPRSIPPPAASRSTPARSARSASSTSSTKTTARSRTSSSSTTRQASDTASRRQPVHGEIDWARRFDHMQQHTGQHVLSAAFDRLFGVRTVSFHLGAARVDDRSRRASCRRAEIAAAETEANRVVWEDRPVTIRFATAEEAARAAAAQGTGARRHAAADRRRRLRPVGVRRHARRAHRRHRHHRRRVVGAVQGRPAAWSSCAAAARSTVTGRCATRSPASVRLLSVLPAELPAAIERLQAEASERQTTLDGARTGARALPRGGARRECAKRRRAGKAGARRRGRRRERSQVPRVRDRRRARARRRPRVGVASGRSSSSRGRRTCRSRPIR